MHVMAADIHGCIVLRRMPRLRVGMRLPSACMLASYLGENSVWQTHSVSSKYLSCYLNFVSEWLFKPATETAVEIWRRILWRCLAVGMGKGTPKIPL